MLCFRLTSTLLLAAVYCLLTSAEKVTTCDGNHVHRLSCAMTDSAVISVQSALYGREDRETCSAGKPESELSNTECSQDGTLDIIKNRCNGKRVCELNSNMFHTPNPCDGTYKYLETVFTCLPANHLITCEHSAAHLYCDSGQVIIVHSADYGRHDQTTCSYQRPASQVQDVLCSKPTRKVAESCNGKNNCTIYASNSVFGDPCAGTYKYLELVYTCEYPA